MKAKGISNRIFKVAIAFVIVISYSPFLSLRHEIAMAAGSPLTYKFEGFSEDAINQFSVNGAAEVPEGSNFIRLTPATTEQSGAVFHKNPLNPKNNYSFSTVFSFRMSNPSAAGPSDGLTFTIQTGTSSQSATGGSLGYYDIKPSFTVKYDTFLNTVYNDPSANYIGIAENGELVNQSGWYTDLDQYNTANGTDYVLSNGTLYYTWIDYDGLNQNVQVRLGTSPDRANSQKILDANNIDLGPIFDGSSYYAGFTGATGYPNYETNDVYSWYFADDYAPVDYAQNRLPTASDDTSTTETNIPVSGQINGADPDGDLLTYEAGQQPSHGSVTANDDGTWTYTPEPDYVGEDSFTIIVNDGYGGQTEAAVTIAVTEQDPSSIRCTPSVALINGSFEEPLVTSQTFIYLDQDTVPGWKTTDSTGKIEVWRPVDSLPSAVHQPASGEQMAELNAYENGLLYQDVVTEPGQRIYWRLAHKGRNGVDTMRLRIGPVTQNPYDTPEVAQMTDGNAQWGYYTGSYIVPDGQTVTRFGFEAVSTANNNIGAGNFLDDIFLGTGPCGVVTKFVDPSEDIQEGSTLTYTVNFKNEGGDETASTVFTDNIPAGTEYVPGSLKIVSGPNSGTLTDAEGDDQGEFLAGDNRVVVRLGNGANASQAGRIPNEDTMPGGTTVQFQVKVLSNTNRTTVANQATVEYDNLLSDNHVVRKSNDTTVEVNLPPITPDFEESTWTNTTVTGDVYGVDANGDSLTFAKGSDPQNGTVTVYPDGTWEYAPNPDFIGTDSFTVTVSDGKGGTSTSTVTVNVVEPPNQAPSSDNDEVTTQQDTSVTGSVYGTDPDGDTLTYAVESDPENGTLTVNPDGSWTYEPNPGYVGPDIFTISVSDGQGGVTTSTVMVDVTGRPNGQPTAPDENVTVDNDTPLTGKVEGTDPDGDPLTYAKGEDPEHGEVTVNEDGTWTYIPDPDYVGEDSFTVIVDDGNGGTTEVTITVDVTERNAPPANRSPVVSDDRASTEKNTPVTDAVYGTDPDGDPLTYAEGEDPEHGEVTVNEDGTWTYTPDSGYVGEDSFTVIVDDGKGGTTEVTITVNVTDSNSSDRSDKDKSGASNRPPTAPDENVTVNKDTLLTGTVEGTDPDGGSLTYTKGENPEHGTVIVKEDGTWIYTPALGYIGEDRFTVIVEDDEGGKTEVTITIDVTPPTAFLEGSDPDGGTASTDLEDNSSPSAEESSATEDVTAVSSASDQKEESANLTSKADQTGIQNGNKLPNTATNLYNLGFIGMLILLAGFILRRKSKVK